MNLEKSFLTLAVALAAVATASAFEFDAATWRRDARNVPRLEKLSLTMRTNFRTFATQFKGAQTITGEQHAMADHTIQAYARIRHMLGVIVEHWEESVPEREPRADELEGRIRGATLGLAASVVLLDNAVTMLECFKGTIWESRLNQGAKDRGKWYVSGLFRDVAVNLATIGNREALQAGAMFIGAYMGEANKLAAADPLVKWQLDYVTSSAAVRATKDEGFFGRLAGSLSAQAGSWTSRFCESVSGAMNAISKVFGNSMGSIHTGVAEVSGPVRERVHAEMMALLQPGDVLLDKTRFALTDRFIPGHFGHVAIWLGTPSQMEELGVFDTYQNHQSVKRAQEWRERLMSGHSVLEALRPGVTCNKLEDFLNLDEVLVLRLKQADRTPVQHRKLIAGVLCRGLYHLGQDYDFNFDVNTSNTIVCSELVYQAFPESVKWPTEKTMGRPTISPDNVAVLAGPAEAFPFEVVYFYAEGKSHSGPEASRAMWDVLKVDGAMPSGTTPSDLKLLRAIETLKF